MSENATKSPTEPAGGFRVNPELEPLERFLDALRATPRDWYLTWAGEIRRDGGGREWECPLCAAAKLVDPGFGYELIYWEASPLFGVQDIETKIALAADNARNCDPELRRKLLEACGLEEREPSE